MNRGTPISLTDEQRVELERRVRSQTLDVRAVRRARIVLLAADGLGNRQIARELGIGRIQAGCWRDRFAAGGLAAIAGDLPRSGRRPRIDAAEIVRRTTQTTPQAATHWSTRKLAAELGISDTTVLKVWRANGLKPHWSRPSRSRAIRSSSRNWRISSDCTCRRPSMPWCCAATRRARCRRWTAPNRGCR